MSNFSTHCHPTSPHRPTLAALQAAVDECEALLKQWEPLRPQFSVGMVCSHDHMGCIEADALNMALTTLTMATTTLTKEPTPWPH